MLSGLQWDVVWLPMECRWVQVGWRLTSDGMLSDFQWNVVWVQVGCRLTSDGMLSDFYSTVMSSEFRYDAVWPPVGYCLNLGRMPSDLWWHVVRIEVEKSSDLWCFSVLKNSELDCLRVYTVHCTVAVINTRQELKEFSSFGYSHHIYDSLYVHCTDWKAKNFLRVTLNHCIYITV